MGVRTLTGRPRTVRSAAGIELAVTEFGDPDAAETVVLLHGWPDTSLLWTEIAPILAADYHVVVYDQRGHGQSSSPAHWQAFAFPELIDDLRAVIADVSPSAPAHVVGHDFGAMYAWEAICSEGSEAFATFTSVAGTNLDHWGLWTRKALRRPTLHRLNGMVRQALSSSYIVWLFVPGVPRLLFSYLGRERVWTRVLQTISGVPRGRAYLADTLASDMLSGVRIYRANIGRLFHPRVQHTSVPVQLIVALHDVAIQPIPLEDAAVWSDELVVRELPAGHWAPFTHPREIAELVRAFVSAHPRLHPEAEASDA